MVTEAVTATENGLLGGGGGAGFLVPRRRILGLVCSLSARGAARPTVLVSSVLLEGDVLVFMFGEWGEVRLTRGLPVVLDAWFPDEKEPSWSDEGSPPSSGLSPLEAYSA